MFIRRWLPRGEISLSGRLSCSLNLNVYKYDIRDIVCIYEWRWLSGIVAVVSARLEDNPLLFILYIVYSMAVIDEYTKKQYEIPTTESTHQVVPPTDQDEDENNNSTANIESTTIPVKEIEGLRQDAVPEGQENVDLERSGTRASSTVEYSVFSTGLKRYIVIAASCAGFFSPLSSQIYFPAVNTLSKDLNVSISLINLTMTSYMVSPIISFSNSESRLANVVVDGHRSSKELHQSS